MATSTARDYLCSDCGGTIPAEGLQRHRCPGYLPARTLQERVEALEREVRALHAALVQMNAMV